MVQTDPGFFEPSSRKIASALLAGIIPDVISLQELWEIGHKTN
jgi:hypothetical protein